MGTRLQSIEHICRKFQVKALYVFGSRSAEIAHAVQDEKRKLQQLQSDLDIGVLTKSELSVEEKVGLMLELEELFSVPRVDLVILQETDPFLAANVIRGERIYAQDSYAADEYDLFVLRRAGDLAELERERTAMILQKE
jgi:predicted nucleotidyltransferase